MSVRADVGIERLIQGLEQELLEAADEEFVAAAHELGMNPGSRGSAAFIGVKDLSPQLLAALRRAVEEHRHEAQEERGPGEPGHSGTTKRNADA